MESSIEKLLSLSTVPNNREAFEKWLEQGDALSFLRDNARAKDVVVYAALPHTFVHAVLVPAESVSSPDVPDLMSWNCNPCSSWGVCSSASEAWIEPPLSDSGSKTLTSGEQLVFARSFEGVREREDYVEILQEFAHVSGIHQMPERSAWCRLDRRGDIEDVVRVHSIEARGDYYGGTVVTFDHRALAAYAALSRAALVWMFNFTRFRPNLIGGWNYEGQPQLVNETGLFYRRGVQPGCASYVRGVQICRIDLSRETILQRLWRAAPEAEKQYATFIAHDWKHGRAAEISCSPSVMANSGFPFEMTPVFFRPEVLRRYKADRDKYSLTSSSISCRGSWHLETYDINEANQVHTYLVYLSRLPYEEQLHWKAHNEPPNAALSKRAVTADFEAGWDLGYDPLPSLKQKLRDLRRRAVPWWTFRADDLVERVQYPVTASTDEWKEEILALDQLLVEGFETSWLRKKAKALGRTPEPSLASLKLAAECLIGLGFEEDHAGSTISPLREVHDLRSKLKGHASGQTGQSIKSSAIATHGSLPGHFKHLCRACDEAMEIVIEAFLDPRMS